MAERKSKEKPAEVDNSRPLLQEHWDRILSMPWKPLDGNIIEAVRVHGNVPAYPKELGILGIEEINSVNRTFRLNGNGFRLTSVHESRRKWFMDKRFKIFHLVGSL